MRIFFVAALGIVVLAALFALQNSQAARIAFFGWVFEGPLVMVLLITFAAGILAGWLAAIPSIWKQSRKVSGLKRELRQPPPGQGRQGQGDV